MPNLIGQSLGRYHILEQLGEGGMAIVYKAFDTRLETEVAVKIIRTERLAPEIAELSLKRFKREAQALAHLTHPNLVKVMDFGEYEGKPYLVMPYLPGQTLKHRLKGQPIPYREAARLLLPIARALEYTHPQGVIHRDVKPSNILITESGEPMLSDFGIAKILEEEATMDLTGTATSVGTPEYMAPEQATSKSIDQRVDIYALGVVLYEMVTGRKPYIADTPLAVLIKHSTEPLPSPRRFVPDLPEAVERVIIKALAKNPDDRFQNMSEFGVALERIQDLSKENTGKEALTQDLIPQKERGSGFFSLSKLKWVFLLAMAGCLLILLAVGGIALLINQFQPSQPGLSMALSPIPTLPSTVFHASPSSTLTPSRPQYTETPEKIPLSIVPVPANVPFSSGNSIWNKIEFRELMSPGSMTYDVNVLPGETWKWGANWCSFGKDKFPALIANFNIEFLINKLKAPESGFLIAKKEYAGGWYCQTWETQLSNWPARKAIELTIHYWFDIDINDGKNVYPAGDYRQIIIVHVGA